MKSLYIAWIGLLLFGLINVGIAHDLPETIEKEYSVQGAKLSVDIRIDACEINVAKSDNPRGLYVKIEYDPGVATPEITYDSNEGEFRLEMEYPFMAPSNEGHAPIVYVELPSKPVIDFESHVKAGEMEYHLGDLTLRNCKIKSYAGELTVDFALPNKTEMERLSISTSVGESELKNLGNAQFKKARINNGIGELTVDFAGLQSTKGTASIDNNLGAVTVSIPRNVPTRMRVKKAGFLTDYQCSGWFTERHGVYYSRNYTKSGEHLDLLVSSGIGEMDINTH
ncbi:MAG: hypothetical protein K9N46_00390 [Candidatus Marinimicrobia bacterium]|nr:hypothetical protein [Candidatus Neomarinimicrobiota bacterium]MCF7829859.1 hypothetical protein [Candidatus Neomarinimicrobiota bacterium]MCF7879178.1 hypothetical protein [Candidatus Neomarinimicrobiota bacterium]